MTAMTVLERVPKALHRDLENYPVFSSLGPTGPEVMCNFIFAITESPAKHFGLDG